MALSKEEKRVKEILRNQHGAKEKKQRLLKQIERFEAIGNEDAAESIYEQVEEIESVLSIYEEHCSMHMKRDYDRAVSIYGLFSELPNMTLKKVADIFSLCTERIVQIMNIYAKYVTEILKEEVNA